MFAVVDGSLALLFDGVHLVRVVVVVRERPIDVSNIDAVTIGDRPRFETAVLNLRFNELDGDSSTFEMWLVV